MPDETTNGSGQPVDERSPPPEVWANEHPDDAHNGAVANGWDHAPGAAERVPDLPMNTEVEQALLAAVLQDNRAFDIAAEIGVKAEHFSDQLHTSLWQTSSYLIVHGRGASALTVGRLYPDDREYLASLQAAHALPSQAADHARTIRDLYIRRQLIVRAEDLIERAHKVELDHDAGQVLEHALGELFILAETGVAEGAVESVESVAVRVVREIEEIKARGGRVAGLSTGFHDLDAVVGGFEAGDLIILAARPGMGKTALATGTSVNVANDGGAVLFFSLEMTKRDLVRRLLAE